MKSIIRNVINNGGYKLSDVQRKIKKAFVWGDISEEDADELLLAASDNISAEAERPDVSVSLKSLQEQITKLNERVTELEGRETEEGYPEWKAWDGNTDDYKCGAIVSHNGKLWESIYPLQNTWEPGTQGTDNLWVEYVE